MHLKRTSMPTSWNLKRKNTTFVKKPNPGSHKKNLTTSIVNLLRDELKFALNLKEAKFIVSSSNIFVNGKKVNDTKFPVGIFDLVEFKDISKKFMVILNEFGKISLLETKEDLIFLKVTSKTILKKRGLQINFANGYNIFTDEKVSNKAGVGDTILYDFKNKKIVKIQSLKEGIFAYIFDGKFKGNFCKITNILNFNGLSADKIEILINGKKNSTAKKYCFVIGEEEVFEKFFGEFKK